LFQTELPQQWARYQPRLVLLALGEVPFFAANNVSEPRIYISTFTLQHTDPDDWPALMLMASGYLQTQRRSLRAVLVAIWYSGVWALVTYFLATDFASGSIVLALAVLVMPMVGANWRGQYLRQLYNWLKLPEKQHRFLMAVLRYYAGFEPRPGSTKMRRHVLNTMLIPREQAMALLAEMEASRC
jgi:hypothetical protein